LFPGADGLNIAYRAWEKPKHGLERGAIVLLNGYSESMEKYRELVFDLAFSGYSIYTMDFRGQGYSDRFPGIDDPDLVHIDSYDNYVADIKTFFDTVVAKRKHKHTFIVAHSTGALAAALFSYRYKNRVSAQVFTSPNFGPNSGGYYDWVVRWRSWLVYNSETYGKGGPSDPRDATFEENQNTTDRDRFEILKRTWIDVPSSYMAGPSYGWILKTFTVAKNLVDNLARKIIPNTLILQAENDVHVRLDRHEEYCRKARQCYLIPFKNAKHDLFWERDEIRDQVLFETKHFLKRVTGW